MEAVSIRRAARLKDCSRPTMYNLIKQSRVDIVEKCDKVKVVINQKFHSVVLRESYVEKTSDKLAVLEGKVERLTEEFQELKGFVTDAIVELKQELAGKKSSLDDRKLAKRAATGEVDWQQIREAIQNKAKKLGSRRELARLTGVGESTLRMFINGHRKTLAKETLEKIKKVVQ